MGELRAALAIAQKDLRTMMRYRLYLPSMIFNPLYQGIVPAFLFGAAFAVGGRQVGLQASIGTEDLSGFLFMGGIVSAIVSTAFWTMAMSIRNEMDMGTLEPTWLTPTRRETIVIGRAIQGMTIVVIIQVILFLIGIAFFGLRVRPEALWALPSMLVTLVAMVGVGYLIAALVLLLKEANFFVDTSNFLFTAISGVAVPIVFFPGFVQVIAWVLPTTWGVEILRFHAIGARTVLDPMLEYAALVVTAVAFLPLGLWAFRRADRYTRVHGTIAQH